MAVSGMAGRPGATLSTGGATAAGAPAAAAAGRREPGGRTKASHNTADTSITITAATRADTRRSTMRGIYREAGRGPAHPPARLGHRGVGGPCAAVCAAGQPRPAGPGPARRGKRDDGIEPRHRAPEGGVSDPVRRLRGDRGPRPGPLDQPAV